MGRARHQEVKGRGRHQEMMGRGNLQEVKAERAQLQRTSPEPQDVLRDRTTSLLKMPQRRLQRMARQQVRQMPQ
jgi:hypothetical protein